MSPTFPFEFSFLRMGPCAYAAIQERYVILLDNFWKHPFEEGVWDESMAPAEWKRQQTSLVGKLLTCLASNGGAALRPEDIRHNVRRRGAARGISAKGCHGLPL